MESFLHSVASVAIVLLLTALGYLCSAMGWMDEHAKKFLSKYLISIAVPVMSIYGLCANLTREELLRSGTLLLVSTLATTLLFLLSYAAARLMKLPRRRFGVFMMSCSLSNMIFIGYPICLELFGEASTPYVMLNYFVNVCFIHLVGRLLVRWSGGYDDRSFKDALVNILTTPPVLGVLAGAALILLGVTLPDIIMSTLRYVNGTVTPLALLLAGGVIYEIGLQGLRPDRDLSVVLAFRFLLSPALALGMCALFGAGGLARGVYAIQFAMPVMSLTVAYATEFGADEHFAAEGVALSTVASFLVIPILMLVL